MTTKVYLTPEEVECLAQAATCVRDELLVRVLFWGSCRISEALAIQVDDVDPIQGTITIKHLKTRVRLLCPHCDTRLSRTAIFCPGCGKEVPEPLRKEQETHRIRTIPLEKQTMARLVDFIRRDGTEGLIFKIGRIHAQYILKACARRAGIGDLVNLVTGKKRGISPHRLRDAFAIMAVQQDDSTDAIRMLQEHLGHQSIATTMKYRKVSGTELREWYKKLKS
ncbi:MAG TPA: site-specific integrase [Dehalococcoidia bacterium]|nr:site-specific integrase [Dehalococcoidia bacterium]